MTPNPSAPECIYCGKPATHRVMHRQEGWIWICEGCRARDTPEPSAVSR